MLFHDRVHLVCQVYLAMPHIITNSQNVSPIFHGFPGKSITETQLHGYNHKTTSKVCHADVRSLYVLVLLSIEAHYNHEKLVNRLDYIRAIFLTVFLCFSYNILSCSYSNFIQLTSSTLH